MARFTISLEWRGMESDRQMQQFGKLLASVGIPGQSPYSRRPWVAEITGLDPKYGLRREFINGQIDYSKANSKFSRFVYLHFHLQPEGIYEVAPGGSCDPSSRYFLHAWQTTTNNLTAGQVERWFRENAYLESTC